MRAENFALPNLLSALSIEAYDEQLVIFFLAAVSGEEDSIAGQYRGRMTGWKSGLPNYVLVGSELGRQSSRD